MASAKQRAWNKRFGDFVRKNGRAPRKGELKATGGARKSNSVANHSKPKGRARRAASRARAGASRAHKATVAAVGPNRPLLHALAVTAGGAAAPYAESAIPGAGTAVKVATGYLTGSPGLQDTGLFEAGARLAQGFSVAGMGPSSSYGRVA